MYIVIEDNPNCQPTERVFSESGPSKIVLKLNTETPSGSHEWCDVIAVEEGNLFTTAKAVQVEDSGAGNAWLIYGGSWGIRFRPAGSREEWTLSNTNQWGTPFKVLDMSGEDIQFGN